MNQEKLLSQTPEPQYQILNSAQLAERLNLPESWIRQQVRSRAMDPIPHVRFGRYVRFEWGSPDLSKWVGSRRYRKALD